VLSENELADTKTIRGFMWDNNMRPLCEMKVITK
jgi:hypothetical protein